MGAISFGTDILKRAVKSRDDQELLMDALSLMGYTDATKAPCGQMMGQQVPLTGCDAHHKRLQQAASLMGCEDAVTAIQLSYIGLAVS